MQQEQGQKSVKELIADQQVFYRHIFGWDCDFSGITIPPKPEGFGRLLVIARGMTPERVYDQCEKRFKCWKYTGDGFYAVGVNDRNADFGAYALWVRECARADEEHTNKSADDLKRAKVKGITLLERLIYELQYFTETGKHLDNSTITLCSGSRDFEGRVPRVRWTSMGFEVNWASSHRAGPYLRTREVVAAFAAKSLYLASRNLLSDYPRARV
jgi:hypothetical protein